MTAGLLLMVSLAGCQGSGAKGDATPTAAGPSASGTPATASASGRPTAASAGFDACSLLTADELEDLVSVGSLHISHRTQYTNALTCGYSTGESIAVPGTLGSRHDPHFQVDVTASDPPPPSLYGFLGPGGPNSRDEELQKLPGSGRAAYLLDSRGRTPGNHSATAWVILGNRFVRLDFSIPEGGEVPVVKLAALLRKAAQRLPDKMAIQTRDLRGRCAELDLGAMKRAELPIDTARTTEGPDGDIACSFVKYQIRIMSGPRALRAYRAFIGPDGPSTKPIPGVKEESQALVAQEEDGLGGIDAWIVSGDKVVQFVGGSVESGPVVLEGSGSETTIPPKTLAFLHTLTRFVH